MALAYRIEKMDKFPIVGIKRTTTNENGQGMRDIPALWSEVHSSGKIPEILPLMDRPPFGILGLSVYGTDPQDLQKFDYYIACASGKPVPDGMEAYTVPAFTWAVFPCKMAEIMETNIQIVTQWQAQSGYKLVNSGYETGVVTGGAPDIELYGEGDSVELWVAVTEKA